MIELKLKRCTHAAGARAALWLRESHVLHAPALSCGENGELEELSGARALILNTQCHSQRGEKQTNKQNACLEEALVLEYVPVIFFPN